MNEADSSALVCRNPQVSHTGSPICSSVEQVKPEFAFEGRRLILRGLQACLPSVCTF